ncbi:MAG: sigma-70 family RNA polymerase sigma factor [Gemmataceae bacterium]|nr:sigma-70 family RNA polymerase sigma factor [Gemmataceae bacterium]
MLNALPIEQAECKRWSVMTEDPSAKLLARVRDGDERAAEQLFRRYAERLIAVAAARLSEKLARRVDPEDVVQSAYRSFFVRARRGGYVLRRSGDLWRLLVGITLHKLHHQAERHTAGKRAMNKEQGMVASDESADGLMELIQAREPTPLEAATLADEVENVLRQLEPHQRPILELRLQGHNQAEIAKELQCSERTVRRILDKVNRLLEER